MTITEPVWLDLPGTKRTRSLQETWSRVSPLLADFGITRIADLTTLDRTGVPVFASFRPGATTLVVSQGKGIDPLAARLSAVMESIEFAAAERLAQDGHAVTTAAESLDLGYPLSALPGHARTIVGHRTPIPWVPALTLDTARQTFVPFRLVALGAPRPRLGSATDFSGNTTGLAAGNDVAEASLHALYELVEREALTRASEVVPIDPLDGAGEASVLARAIRDAGLILRVDALISKFAVPAFRALVWSEDFPTPAIGAGAHGLVDIALTRAITEAIQSRVTAIAGARDDLPVFAPSAPPAVTDLTGLEAVRGRWRDFVDPLTDIRRLNFDFFTASGYEPMRVVLLDREELAVVKIIWPGTLGSGREQLGR